ncbi:hypothetical protein L1987_20366 [Smallanthus sonchifolius]|uniref:Uncharacterized protein n=1 Tax=Smallanthus sonchifolius TaxID=185202 RepID=A0ACB9IR55_9ASTR|nr:hypothetical protein L1987_20366 [Smallanthus sonchifolius]
MSYLNWRCAATDVAMRHFKEAIKEFQLLCKTTINMENVHVGTLMIGVSTSDAEEMAVKLEEDEIKKICLNLKKWISSMMALHVSCKLKEAVEAKQKQSGV